MNIPPAGGSSPRGRRVLSSQEGFTQVAKKKHLSRSGKEVMCGSKRSAFHRQIAMCQRRPACSGCFLWRCGKEQSLLDGQRMRALARSVRMIGVPAMRGPIFFAHSPKRSFCSADFISAQQHRVPDTWRSLDISVDTKRFISALRESWCSVEICGHCDSLVASGLL